MSDNMLDKTHRYINPHKTALLACAAAIALISTSGRAGEAPEESWAWGLAGSARDDLQLGCKDRNLQRLNLGLQKIAVLIESMESGREDVLTALDSRECFECDPSADG